jgi:hypothetical protein
MSQLFVKVEDGKVTQVWDTTPPANEAELWREAIEVRPETNSKRQGFTGHSFDLTKTPVEIVWEAYDFSIEERQGSLKMGADFEYRASIKDLDETADAAAIATAKAAFDAKVAEIEAATTHEALDLF